MAAIQERDTTDPGRANPPQREGRRILYWWTVPERPGVGEDMVRFAGIWLAAVVVFVVVVGLLVG